MTEPTDWNSKIIAEFRANGGHVGGPFEGAPLLLLHTVGAKRYHNLRANPRVRAEIGTQTIEADARVADQQERDRIWAAQKQAYPGFADYEQKTTRQIPVVILDPVR